MGRYPGEVVGRVGGHLIQVRPPQRCDIERHEDQSASALNGEAALPDASHEVLESGHP
jgi:hypothetical protein